MTKIITALDAKSTTKQNYANRLQREKDEEENVKKSNKLKYEIILSKIFKEIELQSNQGYYHVYISTDIYYSTLNVMNIPQSFLNQIKSDLENFGYECKLDYFFNPEGGPSYYIGMKISWGKEQLKKKKIVKPNRTEKFILILIVLIMILITVMVF